MSEKNRVGEKLISNEGCEMEIIEYVNYPPLKF